LEFCWKFFAFTLKDFFDELFEFGFS